MQETGGKNGLNFDGITKLGINGMGRISHRGLKRRLQREKAEGEFWTGNLLALFL